MSEKGSLPRRPRRATSSATPSNPFLRSQRTIRQLKANENFMQLQEELAGTESKIAYSRQFYNDNVMVYNTKIQQFPTNIIARMFKFVAREFFKTDSEDERKPVKVKFE